MYEKCGVVGIYSLKEVNIVPMIITCLKALQHRGQESWGMTIPNYQSFKRSGIVSLRDEKTLKDAMRLKSNTGVGHVRYSTTGKSIIEKATLWK